MTDNPCCRSITRVYDRQQKFQGFPDFIFPSEIFFRKALDSSEEKSNLVFIARRSAGRMEERKNAN